jgi:hypothetical protein
MSEARRVSIFGCKLSYRSMCICVWPVRTVLYVLMFLYHWLRSVWLAENTVFIFNVAQSIWCPRFCARRSKYSRFGMW